MYERRKNTRKPVNSKIEVIDTADNNVVGTIADISIAGILIKSTHQFNLNEYFNFLVKLPKNDQNEKRDIELFVEPKWIEKIKKQQYDIGCQIIKISIVDRKILEDYINKELT